MSYDQRLFTAGIAFIRIGLGLVFFTNGLSKLTGWDGIYPFPGFLIDSEGARNIIEHNVQTHPVGLYYSFIHDIILPNWGIFSPIITLTELVVGLCLIFGLLTPLFALVGAAFILHLNFSNWDRNIWMWEYAVEWIPLIALALIRAGRFWGLDARLADRLPRWPLT